MRTNSNIQRNKTLFLRQWIPESEVCRLCILIHGFNDHSGRYEALATALMQEGIATFIPDLPGHGKSAGQRGHIPNLSQCIDSLEQFANDLSSAYQDVPRILYGHSFGGLAAIRWLESRPHRFTKAIIESPYLGEGFQIPRWKKFAEKWAGVLLPRLSVHIDLPLESLCHSQEAIQAYINDPQVHNRITAGTFLEIRRQQSLAFDRAEAIDIPILMIVGSCDRVISREKAAQWATMLNCELTQYTETNGLHELHSERDIRLLTEKIRAFVYNG